MAGGAVDDLRDRWRRLARFGPFFAVEVTASRPDGWAPVTALADPEVVGARVQRTAAALAAMAPDPEQAVPARVAASVTQLGLSARLVAVALAATVDNLPVPRTQDLVYADRLGGPFPLAVLSGDAGVSPRWPAAMLALVEPVVDVVVERYRLQPRIAWGNVASGLAGAARMITATEPDLGLVADGLVRDALEHGPLRGTLSEPADGSRRRTTCCLIYQLAGDRSAVCGDCVLR